MIELKKQPKLIIGTVTSNKMNKTIVVKVERKVPHPIYKKYVKKDTAFYAHDEDNHAKIGDLVKIEFQRPISKLKRWKLVEILEKAHEV